MKVIRDGSATVSLAATYSPALSQASVSYNIGLSEIVVRAGLDL